MVRERVEQIESSREVTRGIASIACVALLD